MTVETISLELAGGLPIGANCGIAEETDETEVVTRSNQRSRWVDCNGIDLGEHVDGTAMRANPDTLCIPPVADGMGSPLNVGVHDLSFRCLLGRLLLNLNDAGVGTGINHAEEGAISRPVHGNEARAGGLEREALLEGGSVDELDLTETVANSQQLAVRREADALCPGLAIDRVGKLVATGDIIDVDCLAKCTNSQLLPIGGEVNRTGHL